MFLHDERTWLLYHFFYTFRKSRLCCMAEILFWGFRRYNANQLYWFETSCGGHLLWKGISLQIYQVLLWLNWDSSNLTLKTWNWCPTLFFQLLKEFQMTKPQLEYYVRLWSRHCNQDMESITSNEWMAFLHNSGIRMEFKNLQ